MNNQIALDRYITHMTQAADLLAIVNQYIDDNGEVAPDDVNWTHVAEMAHIVEMLRDTVAFIRDEDEV